MTRNLVIWIVTAVMILLVSNALMIWKVSREMALSDEAVPEQEHLWPKFSKEHGDITSPGDTYKEAWQEYIDKTADAYILVDGVRDMR